MENKTALYIHIPFCKQKCLYCDFPSFAGKEALMMDYIKALCSEIKNKVKKEVSTIFIGGGTPTYLSLECLYELKNCLDGIKKTHDVEFTVEGNPESFSKEKLEVFKSMGVNRLSIGLQAWQNRLLKSIGRIHDLNSFTNSFKLSRDAGFKNINIDLMFGLPGQNIDDWKETLLNVAELNPEHISCYSLIVEEGTPFYGMSLKNKLDLPEEEIERQMYEYALIFLKKRGYEHYEISNFSKHGMESKHNMVYWSMDNYIGCGTGAHSFMNGIRYRNIEDIEKYIYMMNLKNSAVVEEYTNTDKDNMEEFMFMGLRKINGISKNEFKEKFNIDIHSVYGTVINKFLNNKLLLEDNERIYLSSRGIELSNQVMCEFIL
ncbi:oxygen-independent coproporphyrinogen III oxidase [Clostridium sp. YIM B02515]|uniref:Heme chaperone HemW n=1 Tax=Clostridium rhizosphaerae TaxID=2803861 RepID=A0ABS1T766_9CLOT|nr:radical SAM family heme chaperone HemW [Clostridium rhizosphaerae]MBL4935180.1 oxygen-independent coproporphyrinogen III oxidase [Clostridium rhizosphaerae]